LDTRDPRPHALDGDLPERQRTQGDFKWRSSNGFEFAILKWPFAFCSLPFEIPYWVEGLQLSMVGGGGGLRP